MSKRKYPKNKETLYINDEGIINSFSSDVLCTKKQFEKLLGGKVMAYPQKFSDKFCFIVREDGINKSLSLNKYIREEYSLIIFGPVIIIAKEDIKIDNQSKK